MTAVKLTKKKIFCLDYLSKKEGTGRAISQAAVDTNLNRTLHGSSEWADAPLRELRKAELIEHTGADEHAAKVYRITDKGRAALSKVKAEA